MDYLRQQIEASLGRSEELISSDKIRRGFYRYPVDSTVAGVPTIKKRVKEKGTFNSVRLKKYLGFGGGSSSKSKQKMTVDSDDLQQQLQQQAYLEELQLYGAVATMPPSYEAAFYAHHGPLPPGGAHCYRELWASTGTVSVRQHGPFPASFASVSVRKGGRSRGSLQSAIYAWEPYGTHSQNALTSPGLMSPSAVDKGLPLDVYEGSRCTCEAQHALLKSSKKHHRSKCTCAGSGTKSHRLSKTQSRPPLLFTTSAPGDMAVFTSGRDTEYPDCKSGSSNPTGFSECVGHGNAPAPGSRPSARKPAHCKKSRLHRLSDVSAGFAIDQADPLGMSSSLASHPFLDSMTLNQRRSILDCSVNPYDLMVKRRSAPALGSRGEDPGSATANPRKMADRLRSGALTIGQESGSSISRNMSRSDQDNDDDDDDDLPDISLGGQRIRLFGTVRGTLSTKKPNSTSSRLPIPQFEEHSTTSRQMNYSNYIEFQNGLNDDHFRGRCSRSTAEISMSKIDTLEASIDDVGTKLDESRRAASLDDWHEEDSGHRDGDQSIRGGTLRINSHESVFLSENHSRKKLQHKTTITIGGVEKPSDSCVQGAENAVQRVEVLPGRSTSVRRFTDDDDDRHEKPMGSAASSANPTVIAIGQEAVDSRKNRLNLKINFSELSAYLKPILKKAAFNDSSTSSDADGSDTYMQPPALPTDGCRLQKQKKHVHFLSSRIPTAVAEDADLGSLVRVLKSEDREEEEEEDKDVWSGTKSRSPQNQVQDLASDPAARLAAAISQFPSAEELYDDGTSLPNESHVEVPQRNTDSSSSNESPSNQPTGVMDEAVARSSTGSRRDSLSLTSQKVTPKPRNASRHPRHADLRKTNLRRSHSERQVAAVEETSERVWCENKYRATSSISRSNSFKFLPAEQQHAPEQFGNGRSPFPTPTPLARREGGPENAPAHSNKFLTFLNAACSLNSSSPIQKDPNHQPFYQNNVRDSDGHVDSGAKARGSEFLAASLDAGPNSTSTLDTKKDAETMIAKDYPRGSTTRSRIEQIKASLNMSSIINNQKRRTLCKERAKEEDDPSVPPPVDIARLRAIPKFLPRPTLGDRTHHHNQQQQQQQHVCGAVFGDDRTTVEGDVQGKFSCLMTRLHDEVYGNTPSSNGWPSSEEDLYADGSSSPGRTARSMPSESADSHKPLPPIPIEYHSHCVSHDGNSSDDNAIYEQINEPLYEEVPDTISYSSVTSAASGSLGQPRKSIFEGASKTEILSYLEDAKERGVENILQPTEEEDESELLPEEEEEEPVEEIGSQNFGTKRHHRNRISNISNLSDSSHTSEESFQNEDIKDVKTRHSFSSAEVERNDSGVGSETSKPSRLRRQSRLSSSEQVCVDCDQTLEHEWDAEGAYYVDPLVCRKCCKKRSERKEIILEIVETEVKYGRDLKIIKEEFYRPMLVAGLLTEEQLNNIFLNLDQLIDVNEKFAEKLRDAVDIAAEQGDEDYSTLNAGKVFLESSAMLHAFETYCVRQGSASLLLTNLEKDKELLRIFLKVSQMENTLLRRLNLNSFLMVPVQRVTKYPLLLNRLYKVSPHHHQDREALREAQLKIELHLEHINQQAKDLNGMNIWRRISNISNSQRRNLLEPVIGNIKFRKMALEILQWSGDEVRFVMEGRLQYTLLSDHMWNKREKTLKFSPVHGLLITLGTPNSNYRPDLADREFIFPRNTGIREATLVLIKEKNNRFNLLREPLHLHKCVISSESDLDDIFEVQEFSSKDAYLMKAEDSKESHEWLKMLRYHAKDLGAWRRRRNALANIMINGMVARREWL